MGTIAARDSLRVLDLTEQVAAALLIAVRQGVWLRSKVAAVPTLQAPLKAMFENLATDIAVVDEDRKLEPELRLLLARISERAWNLYD